VVRPIGLDNREGLLASAKFRWTVFELNILGANPKDTATVSKEENKAIPK
jgi:hypothetical protein